MNKISKKDRVYSVAVIIPCKDEALSIPKVISDLRQHLPNSEIIIGDNYSKDQTSNIAESLGCKVIMEPKSGKGNTIRALLSHVSAEYIVMIDGDGESDVASIEVMLETITKFNADMVIARRISSQKNVARKGHKLGNILVTKFFNILFKSNYQDVLSGYRILSSNFAKNFPCNSNGFEVEVELNAYAARNNASVLEVESRYLPRAYGTKSKLRTFIDGFYIIKKIIQLRIRYK